jgi:hypothetical protein
MEARRVIEGELRNIGVHGLSNDGIKAPFRVSPVVKCLLKWIFPIIYAIFYASERALPLSGYISRLRKNCFCTRDWQERRDERDARVRGPKFEVLGT